MVDPCPHTQEDAVRKLFDLIQHLRDQGGFPDHLVQSSGVRPAPMDDADDASVEEPEEFGRTCDHNCLILSNLKTPFSSFFQIFSPIYPSGL